MGQKRKTPLHAAISLEIVFVAAPLIPVGAMLIRVAASLHSQVGLFPAIL
jgi:hypothetical protein